MPNPLGVRGQSLAGGVVRSVGVTRGPSSGITVTAVGIGLDCGSVSPETVAAGSVRLVVTPRSGSISALSVCARNDGGSAHKTAVTKASSGSLRNTISAGKNRRMDMLEPEFAGEHWGISRARIDKRAD